MDIDLNCDLGEGSGSDSELMPLITSANICCGFHAGNETITLAALREAARHGIQTGAHPGFADREHFGRRELARSERQVFEECVVQLDLFLALARNARVPVRYLKPHGALYNLSCRDDAYARAVVEAARIHGLNVVGLPESRLQWWSENRGLFFIAEGFADRRYRPDGSLVPRSDPDAVIEAPHDAVRHVEWLLGYRKVRTICVHGDNPHALEFVKQLRSSLTAAGHRLLPFATDMATP